MSKLSKHFLQVRAALLASNLVELNSKECYSFIDSLDLIIKGTERGTLASAMYQRNGRGDRDLPELLKLINTVLCRDMSFGGSDED